MSENLTGDVTLPLLVVEGTAVHVPASDENITGVVTLPLLVVAGTLQVSHGLSGNATLPLIQVSGSIPAAGKSLVGDVALLRWTIAGTVAVKPDPTKHLVGNVKLPMWKVYGREQHNYHIYSLTGPVRENGSQILVFVGPPDRVVKWTITTGSGQLVPYTDFTDRNGMAACLYKAGGFEGDLVITVTYGS